jgi:aminoglycoside phosphotransferase (APT) family kinase protein
MALSVHRPLEQLAADIARWLDATHAGPHELIRCDRPSEGLSSETLLCEARSPNLESTWAFVVRLPPTGDGAFPEYDLVVQAEAQRVAAAHGVPAPTPVELVTDPAWLGSPFLVAPMVSGHVPASMPLFDKWVTTSSPQLQRRLYDALIDQVAAIHRIDAASIDTELPERDIDQDLAYWRRYLDWYADGKRVVPELDAALAWCVDHRPADEPPAALLWGDVRLGNVIYDEARHAVAVLDWEMAMVGAPEHDVAWWLTLEATQDELFGRRVDAFPTREVTCQTYEAKLGRPLQNMEWFEVFAMVRSTAVMTRIGLLYERAGSEGFFPIAENPILPLIARKIEEAS